MRAGIFKRDILTRAAEELESKLHVELELLTRKNARIVTGYEITIRERHHFISMIHKSLRFKFGEDSIHSQ